MASECLACGTSTVSGLSCCNGRICMGCSDDPNPTLDDLCDKLDAKVERLGKLEAFAVETRNVLTRLPQHNVLSKADQELLWGKLKELSR